MMTQTQVLTPTQTPSQCGTCADCPQFRDFHDARKRGWCSVFGEITRSHNPRTGICDVTLNRQAKQQNRLTVMVELVSHELDIDPENGVTFPKDTQVIEVTVPVRSRQAVERAIAYHREFQGYFIAGFWEPEKEEF